MHKLLWVTVVIVCVVCGQHQHWDEKGEVLHEDMEPE